VKGFALETFMDFLRHASLLDLLNLLIAIMVILAGTVTLMVARSRTSMYCLIATAVFPLLLGLLTMYMDNRIIDRWAGMAETLNAEVIEASRREASINAGIGATAAALLVLMGMIGLRSKRNGKADSAPPTMSSG
jgi:hypothetical protein